MKIFNKILDYLTYESLTFSEVRVYYKEFLQDVGLRTSLRNKIIEINREYGMTYSDALKASEETINTLF